MGLSDAVRIVRFVLRNSRDFREDHQLSELHDEFVTLFFVLIREAQRKRGFETNDTVLQIAADLVWSSAINGKVEQLRPETEIYKDEDKEE